MAFRMRCPKCNSFDYSIERDRRAYAHGAESSDLIFMCRCGKRLFGDQVVKEHDRQKRDWSETAEDRAAAEQARIREEKERVARQKEMRDALAYRSQIRESKRREEETRREEEARRWREKVAGIVDEPKRKRPPRTKPIATRPAVEPLPAPVVPKPEPRVAAVSRPAPSAPAAKAPAPAPKPAAAPTPTMAAMEASNDAQSEELGYTVCAWHECAKAARKNSKYCSRECSNKNARLRHRLRKQAEKAEKAAKS